MVTAQNGNKQLWKTDSHRDDNCVGETHQALLSTARHETARQRVHTQATFHSHVEVACRWRLLKLTLKSMFLGWNSEECRPVPLCRSSNVCCVRMRPGLLTYWVTGSDLKKECLFLLINAINPDKRLSVNKLGDKQVITDRQTDRHPFSGLFSRTTWVSRTRKVKPF